MIKGLLDLHSVLRWVILILLVITIAKSWKANSDKTPFTQGDRKAALFLLIGTHLNLLIGLYQWLFGRFGLITTKVPEGLSVMKSSFFRFYWVEHPVGMLISVVLITVGYSKIKKSVNGNVVDRKPFWFLLIALILIFVSIPWPFRVDIGRPLLPGMGM